MAKRPERRHSGHPKLDNHFDYRATMAHLILGIPKVGFSRKVFEYKKYLWVLLGLVIWRGTLAWGGWDVEVVLVPIGQLLEVLLLQVQQLIDALVNLVGGANHADLIGLGRWACELEKLSPNTQNNLLTLISTPNFFMRALTPDPRPPIIRYKNLQFSIKEIKTYRMNFLGNKYVLDNVWFQILHNGHNGLLHLFHLFLVTSNWNFRLKISKSSKNCQITSFLSFGKLTLASISSRSLLIVSP